MKIAITGKPGSGKTTLCLRIFDELKDEWDVSGVVTKEVRERGKRVGFLFHDLEDGENIWLAHVNCSSSVRIGKYGVFIENIDRISEKLKRKKAEALIVDEIGPMELKSLAFVKTIGEIMERGDILLFTIHLRSKHPLLEKIRKEFKVFTIDERNRDMVFDEILGILGREHEDKRG